jgi:hypothetical protein
MPPVGGSEGHVTGRRILDRCDGDVVWREECDLRSYP